MHQMITREQMIGPHKGDPYITPEIVRNIDALLVPVNEICQLAELDGVLLEDDPDTGTAISGSRGGSGAGGLRTPAIVSVAVASEHYRGNAVDRVDAHRSLMRWCLTHSQELVKRQLYMEHPQWTSVWCHFQRVPPGSHNRWFIPYKDMTKYPPICIALVEQSVVAVQSFRVKSI